MFHLIVEVTGYLESHSESATRKLYPVYWPHPKSFLKYLPLPFFSNRAFFSLLTSPYLLVQN